ncbi:MAG: biopolymer transporter ExbD [Zavarzinella sp.]
MAGKIPREFDVWFLAPNKVIKKIPFHVVADWIEQAKIQKTDQIKASSATEWEVVGQHTFFSAYFQPDVVDFSEDLIVEQSSQVPVEQEVTKSPAPPIPKRKAETEDSFPSNQSATNDDPANFDWYPTRQEEDDDVDMIPLIDISLVLLIFFMMTATVTAISRIQLPDMVYGTTVTQETDLLRIDIDFENEQPKYALAEGNNAPKPGFDAMSNDVELSAKLDEMLANRITPPKVRIAAHGDLRFEWVEEVMKSLEKRLQKNQIREYSIEVNERGG